MSMSAPAATPAAPTATPQEKQAVTPPALAPASAPAAPASAPAPAAGKPTIESLQAELAKARKEADDARVAAKGKVAKDAQTKQLLALAQAIGIEIPKGDDSSPEALQARLQAEIDGRSSDQAALQAERQSNAIKIAALTAGVPADKATYLDFLLKGNPAFTAMDTADPAYRTSVATLVQTLVAADPILKATPGGATRSGTENLGGAGVPGEVTQKAFNAMNVMERTKLFQTNPELFRRLQSGTAGS